MNVTFNRVSVGRSLFPLIAVTAGLCLGFPETARGTLLTVSLDAPTAVATPGLQTIVLASLKVSGSLASPLSTGGFSTVLTWSTTSAGVLNSDLYRQSRSSAKSWKHTSSMRHISMQSFIRLRGCSTIVRSPDRAALLASCGR